MKSRWILSLLLVLMTFMVGSLQAKEKNSSPPLKTLMAQLFNDLQEVNQGLFYHQYEKVEKAATRIADHPKIRLKERQVIAKALGQKMGQFVQYDRDVHNAAKALAKAAQAGELNLMMKQYKTMVSQCMACHSQFRDKVAKALKEIQVSQWSPSKNLQ